MRRSILALALVGSAAAFAPAPSAHGLRTPAARSGVLALQAAKSDKEARGYGASRRETLYRAAAFGAALGVGVAGAPSAARAQPIISDNVSPALSQIQALEEVQADLFQKVVPSVCYISTEYTSMAGQLNLDVSQLPKGVGTGFVWDKKGHIVTNFHVINKVDNAIVTLTLGDGEQKQYKAKLTGVDPDKDIAVLKVDAPESELAVISVGESKDTRVGQFSFAVGNPFGQDHTLTTGVISGKNREITAPTGRKIKGVIQTDAAINPGNSGGPLLNSNGQLIGINTASLGAGVSAGVGFALPIALARPSIEQLIEFGQVQRAILGISYLERAPTASESERGGLPLVKEGIVVLEVPKGSPGAEAGLQAVQKPATPQGKPTIGDVIVGMNGDKIVDPATLITVLSKYKPGTAVDLKVLRGPEQVAKTLKVKLGAFQGGSTSRDAKVLTCTTATVQTATDEEGFSRRQLLGELIYKGRPGGRLFVEGDCCDQVGSAPQGAAWDAARPGLESQLRELDVVPGGAGGCCDSHYENSHVYNIALQALEDNHSLLKVNDHLAKHGLVAQVVDVWKDIDGRPSSVPAAHKSRVLSLKIFTKVTKEGTLSSAPVTQDSMHQTAATE